MSIERNERIFCGPPCKTYIPDGMPLTYEKVHICSLTNRLQLSVFFTHVSEPTEREIKLSEIQYDTSRTKLYLHKDYNLEGIMRALGIIALKLGRMTLCIQIYVLCKYITQQGVVTQLTIDN